MDRIGVNIVVTGASALVGYAVGGPLAATAGAVVPEIVREMNVARARNTTAVAEHACDLVRFSGPDLVEWVRASDRHAAFFRDAMEAAWDALDADKLRTLGYVLADGISDEAKIDVDQLVIRARRQLEAGHVRVLATLVESEAAGLNDLSQELAAKHAGLSEAIDAILATLSRLGCIGGTAGPHNYLSFGRTPLAPTDFGRRCLDMIRRASG